MKTTVPLGVLAPIAVGIVSYLRPVWALAAIAFAVVVNRGVYFHSGRLMCRMRAVRHSAR